MALTEKQITFARLLASGKTQIEAYKTAYDVKTENDDSIRVLACREANKPHVQEYINEIKEVFTNNFAIEQTKDDKFIRGLIWERMLACSNNKDDSSLARYADILNKMNGTYININKDITDKENNIDKLSIDELKQLINKE